MNIIRYMQTRMCLFFFGIFSLLPNRIIQRKEVRYGIEDKGDTSCLDFFVILTRRYCNGGAGFK